jgi:hypothetical protein
MRRKTRASHRLNALRSADTPALQERRASQTPQGQHALNATHLKQFENAYRETNDQTSLKIRTGVNEMSKQGKLETQDDQVRECIRARRRSEEPDECGNRNNKKQDSQFANALKQNG